MNAIQLLPVSIPMGEPQPLVVDTRLSRAGLEIHLNGSASLARLLPAASSLGVLENATSLVAPHGRATLNLTTVANWMRPISGAAAGIATTGTIAVDSAQLRPAFLPAPVDVQSATVDVAPEQIAWQNVALTYQKMPMHGSLQFPVVCADPVAGCPASFTLVMGATNAVAIEAALGVNPDTGFLSKLFSIGENHPAWPSLRGELQCEQLDVGPVAMHKVAASLAVTGNTLTFSTFDASALGGTVHWSGDLRIDDGTPRWKLKVQVTDAKASALSGLFDENWGTGQVNGDASLAMNGYRGSDLASSAAGDFSFSWQNGSLARMAPAAASQLGAFDRWTGKGTVAGSSMKLTSGGMSRAGRTSNVRGSISFDRELDLTLDTRRGAEKITGTLAQPVVTGAAQP